MTEHEFKQSLTEIMNNDCALPKNSKFTCDDYARLMLEYIGDVDSEFRDGVNYEVFCRWALDGAFGADELCEYLAICIDDEHIMYRVGEDGTDSVFTRTFSALFIAAILERNASAHFIPAKLIRETKDRLVEYYNAERDMRGYVEVGGWAHSAAHGADAIAELMLCPELGKDDIMELLLALGNKFNQGRYVYIDREPERICVCVRRAIERRLFSDAEIESWLLSIDEKYKPGSSNEVFHRYVNKQNFFKTLYFALKGHGVEGEWLKFLEGAVATL